MVKRANLLLAALSAAIFLSFPPPPAIAQQIIKTLPCVTGPGEGRCPPVFFSDANGQGQVVDATHPLPTTATISSVTVNPLVSVTTTDKGGTITLGGTAQAAIASNASRKSYCIINDPAETEVLMVRLNGTASATAGVPVRPGVPACSGSDTIDTTAVSVWAATTGHRWFGYEGQ